MNNQEAIIVLEEIIKYWTAPEEHKVAAALAILALEDQAKRNCKNCIELGKCEIYDNFNIEYCSDFEEKSEVYGMRDSTTDEDKSVSDYIKSISKQTGLDFNDIHDDIVSGANK